MKKYLLKTTLLLSLILATVACEPENQPFEQGSFPKSSALAISQDGKTLYVALADHDKIVAVNASDGETIAELLVEGYPHRLTLLNDGRLAVSSRYAGTVSVMQTSLKKIDSTIEVGADPFEVIQSDKHLIVALSGQAQLARIPLNDADHVEDRIELGQKNPRGMALLPNGELFVSHYLQSTLSTVNLNSGLQENKIELNMDNNPNFEANQLESMTVTPDQTEVVLPHVECNNDPVQFAGGDTFAKEVPYYATGETGYPAVVPSVSRVDIQGEIHLNQGPGEATIYNGEQAEPAGMVSGVLNPLETVRLRDTKVNSPVAVALANNGQLELIVNKGSGNVIIRRSQLKEGQHSIVAEVKVGVGASDIVLSPDGETAYVYNEFTYEVSSFKIPVFKQELVGSKLQNHIESESWDGFYTTEAPLIDLESTHKIANSVLPRSLEKGRILFHSVDQKLSSSGAISCATCHPGGMADGTTWNFAQGKRQTPALWGGIMETSPFHWDNELNGIQGVNDNTLMIRMGGTGLNGTELNDLSAFIDSIPVPSILKTLNPSLVAEGEQIFFSEATNCTSCHSGSHFTDGKNHDVGTGSNTSTSLEKESRFSTPVLHGLAHTGPYMHDGRAETMHDLVRDYVATDKMGKGSHLTLDELEALAAFLETL